MAAWEELPARLQAALDAVARPCASADVPALEQACADLAATLSRCAAAASAEALAAHRNQLLDACAAVGRRLAALEQRAARGGGGAARGDLLLNYPHCLTLLRAATEAARAVSAGAGGAVPLARVRPLLSALKLMCGGGCRALRDAASRGGARSSRGQAQAQARAQAQIQARFLLNAQVAAVRDVVQLASAGGPEAESLGLAALATDGLPPQLCHEWLAVVAGCLQPPSNTPAAGDSGGQASADESVGTVLLLGQPLALLCSHVAFAEHRRAIRGDEQLCRQLARLLTPAICAAAAAVPLPPARRPPGLECAWEAAGHLAAALLSPLLTLEARELEAAADGGGGDMGALLHAAALLLQAAPLPNAVRGDVKRTPAFQLAKLLGWSAAALTQLCREPPGVMLQHSWRDALLPLPAARLTPLISAAGQVQAQAAENVCCALCGVLGLLKCFLQQASSQGTTPPEGGSLACGAASMAAWCDSSAAGLQAVPLAARVAAQLPRAERRILNAVFVLACALADEVGVACCDAIAALGRRAPAAEVQAVVDGLWRLHSAGCRLAHWSRVGGAQLEASDAADLSALLCHQMKVVGAVARLWAPPGARLSRAVRAMAVAHVEALHALLLEGPAPRLASLTADQRADALAGMLQVAPYCPLASMLACSPAAAELASCLSSELSAEGTALVMTAGLIKLSAAATALLLVTGAMEQLLAAGRALVGQRRLQSVSALLLALPAVLRRLAAEASAAVEGAAGGQGTPAEEQRLRAALELHADALRTALDLHAFLAGSPPDTQIMARLPTILPPARCLAEALLAWWRRPEQQAEAALQLAQAAAGRSCAYLRCSNLALGGGPAAGQGEGSSRCSACRAVWYCGTACSHADWRGPGGHKCVCKALGAARAAERAAARAQQQAAGAEGGEA